MKTATLTIEVPDDFEKGDCLKCQYADNFFGGCKVKSFVGMVGFGLSCFALGFSLANLLNRR